MRYFVCSWRQLSQVFMLLVALLLASCATQQISTTGSVRPVSYQNDVDNDRRIASLKLQLQSAPKEAQAPVYLALADAYTEAGLYNDAGAALAYVNQQTLDFDQQLLYLMIKADYLRAIGKAREAVGFLPVDKPNFSHNTRLRLLDLQARVLEAAQQPKRAIEPRLKLMRMLNTSDSVQRNAQVLYEHLAALPTAELQQLANSNDRDYKSWAELVALGKNNKTSQNDLGNWLSKYPDSSVPIQLIRDLQQRGFEQTAVQQINQYPARIALLLPDSGEYAQVGAKIKQGFMDAYLHYNGIDKPEVKFYSSTAMPLESQFANIEQQGADMIVGPLTKENVAIINQIASNLPVLTFNRMDNGASARANLYQFGLIPEDEAEQAAQSAIERNLNNVAIIAPSNPLGLRMASAFAAKLQNLGGNVLGIYEFAPDSRDFSEVVRNALGIERRHIYAANSKRKGRGAADYRQYIRSDLNAIYMVASANQGRGIIPQLRFYDATKIPVLASSQVFDGREQPNMNRDLNGVVFTQPSWLLSRTQYSKTGQIAPVGNPATQRFFALGQDAYKLIPHLSQMLADSNYKFDGQSGALFADFTGIIHRQLGWAVFADGLVDTWQGDAISQP